MALLTAPESSRPRIAAVGTWDGVHLGHRHLLAHLISEGERRTLAPTAVTFATHPLATVRPERVPRMLCTLDERVRRLHEAGVMDVVVLDFDENLRRLTAREFLEMLRRDYGVEAVILGFNNSFGSDRLGSFEDYREAGAQVGVEVLCAPEWCAGEEHVSSSAVRRLIAEGAVEHAAALLSRPVTLSGMVVEGKQLGRTIGFPTANLAVSADAAVPGPGVYAADALLHTGERHRAIVNIGYRPTVDRSPDARESIEAHLLNFHGDLYGHPVTLTFLKRLRDEQRFPDLTALRAQLTRDAAAARQIR
ncbi:MAG: riboflavin biosynthesis protein RibF [Candidatus Amulumruptor caecigallinarius]|nr:riboflavin biosynthesis protein RibF [Candidatus Amulumruptor caecigallinarius]MCM1397545.1 riboflavin biosynthesis protein RibF [Candidatus Amulumruptor caecigallinarius]MCM1454447.1 riboflavin biosynthesis protein RibF [bacterium]